MYKHNWMLRTVGLMVLIVLDLSGLATGGTSYWSDGDGTHLWDTVNNWDVSSTNRPPTADCNAWFWYAPGTSINCIVPNGTNAQCHTINGIGWNNHTGTLAIQAGGSLTATATNTASVILGQLGMSTMIVNGGTLTCSGWAFIGHDSNGILDVRAGGTVNADSIYLPISSGYGTIYARSGAITCENLYLDYGGTSGRGRIDITEGFIIVAGDKVSYYQGFVSSGQITA